MSPRSARDRVTIPGSEKKALADGKVAGEVNPDERIAVTVLLRRQGGATNPAPAQVGTAQLTREAFAAQLGADPNDVERIEAFADDHGLSVAEVNVAAR